MKRTFIVKFILLICITCLTATLKAQNAACPNFDFSQRNFTNWRTQIYLNPLTHPHSTAYSDITLTDTNAPALNFEIITDLNEYDLYTCYGYPNSQLKAIPNGFSQSARIGYMNYPFLAQAIIYSLTVDSNNALLLLHHAIVFHDPEHPSIYQPRFELRIQDSNRNLINGINNNYVAIGGGGVPGFISCGYSYDWKDWSTIGIDLSPIIGQDIDIVCYASQCGFGQHFCHGYFIGECRGLGIQVLNCTEEDTARLEAPNGFVSYIWRDSINTIVGSNQLLKVYNPPHKARYSCLVTNALGDTSLLGCIVEKNIVSSHIVCDSLSKRCYPSRVYLSHDTKVSNDKISYCQWNIIKLNNGPLTEYICADSAFEYLFQDTGYYKIIFSVFTQNGCSAMDTILVYSYPNTGEYVDAGFTSTISLQNCMVNIDAQDTSLSSTLFHRNVWNVYNDRDSSLLFTSNDSNLHYVFQDTGWFRMELMSFTTLGCSDTLSQRFNVDSLFPKTTLFDTACFSYTWNDSVYYQSGTYHQTLRVNSCDSFVTLHLFVNPTHTFFDTIFICNKDFPYTYKDSVFLTVGNHNVNYTNRFGCDSIYYLFLDTNPSNYHIDSISICSNEFPYSYGDSVLYSAGNYNIYFTNQYGCDSIIYLVLQTNPIYHHTDTLILTDNKLPYPYGDSILHSAGNYQIYLSSIHGCDSLIDLTLFIIPTYHHYDTLILCYNDLPYRYGDSVLYAAGHYQIHFTSSSGYDSLISLTLRLNPIYYNVDTVTLCDNELPYQYGNNTIYTGGNHLIHFTTFLGCDSLISLTINLDSTYHFTDTLIACDSELPYYYGDSMLTKAGDYLIEFQSSQGCDSLISVNFNVKTKPATPLKIYGDSLIIQAGNYIYYIDKVNDTDSYQWMISNSSWSGNSTTDTIYLYIPTAGSGRLEVKAINDCGLSDMEGINIVSTVNINEYTSMQWFVGQNIPNPAQKTTLIPFRLPEAGNVTFSLMTINGQILFFQNVEASAGNNSLSYDISTLSNGIYFYIMTYKGQRIVRKMTVQH